MNRRDFLCGIGGASLASLGALGTSASGDGSRPRIKIGQIGTKHAHAGGKISTMRKFPQLFDVVGVVEPDEARRTAVADSATYRGVKWMTEKELLAADGLQAVAVETEVRQLLPVAKRCLSAGLHIHLDKPAGESLPEFKEVVELAAEKKRVIQMGYMFRYNPAFQFLFKALKDGWLGDVFELHAVISKKVGDGTRKQLAEYPGGSMFELGCHVIDAVVYVLGAPDKVTPYVRRTQPDKDALADNQLAVFEYPQATATVRSAVVEVDGARRRQFIVCGTKGTIEIKPLEPPRLTLTLDRDQGPFKRGTHDVDLPRLGGRYDGDFLDLAKMVRGEKQNDWPLSHDLAVQEAVLRASGAPLE